VGAVYLLALYLATALGLALLVRALSGPGQAPSWRASLLLAGLPLVFVAGGFPPGRVLAPTNSLISTPPWLDPELAAKVEAESTAPNPLLLDPLSQMIPWRRAAREHLLINPAQGGGAALLGNGQSAVLFPTELLSRLLSPLRAETYVQGARLLVAAFGLFLLVRSLALSELAALVGAAAWVGCGFLQLWRLHPHSLVAATLPWILWAALALARRPSTGAAVALAVTGALGVYGGHAETLFHGVLLAAVLAGAALPAVLRATAPPQRRRYLAGAGLGVLGAAGLAFLLAAPALLPFVDNLRVSAEWERRAEEPPEGLEAPWGEAAERLAAALTPFALGDPLDPVHLGPEAEAPENIAELGGGGLGAAALLLALVGLGYRRRSEPGEGGPAPRPGPWIWLAVGLAALLVSTHVPGVSRPFGWVRLLEISLLKRLSLGWALAGSVLAAFGAERLARGQGRRGLLVGAAALAVLLGLTAWALPGSRAARGVPLELAALAVAVLGGWVLAGFSRRSVVARGFIPGRVALIPLALLALALVLPRGMVFDGWVPRASSYSFYPDTLGIRDVRERLAQAPPGTRVAGLDAALLPHAAVFFGFEEARANDPMTFAPYERFLETLGSPLPHGGVKLLDPALPGLAFLGVRWIFDHPTMTHRPGVEVVYLGRDTIVYENPRALPRVFVPGEVRIEEDPGAVFDAVEHLEDFARLAVVRWQPDLPPPGVHPNGTAAVTALAVAPGRVEATVRAESTALVATSQPAIPGWRLLRDGEEFAPLSVNGAFLGAAVEAGESRLEFVYDPRSWRWGRRLFAAGLALVAAALALGRLGPARLRIGNPARG
jgi:hypothetical protein